MEEEKKKKEMGNIAKASTAENSSRSVSALQALSIHLICGLGLAIGLWVAHNLYSMNVVSDPSRTLRLIWIVESPIVTLLYSWFRLNPEQCSYLKAVGRGILALPVGALVTALGAIVLGAPVSIEYLPKTINWSLLMSSCMFVPAASVFGSSWSHWQRIFAYTKPNESLEYMICIPAHGAVIGAWLGAWPMPLDWERPWQEWPVCVTYGAMIGYLLAMVVSLGFVLVHGGRQHRKRD
ncbi:PIGF/3-ketodihydrosphingosine reductase fusion protein-like [Hevea brasiliensis]|uniref:PIGF/3-ketodihydrosphingosine reductase fusion protein-like n=1 Tax=Hevea brasiliensis TaxID=3981 RepID=UPI0025E06392|nr:PIGF/3-ketodihydrosphingosine reductase fusion protein-like [Hevea brasiliensis]